MAVTSYIARYAEFLKMWDRKKAILRKMYIHMPTIGYKDEEAFFTISPSFEVLKTDIHSCHVQSTSLIID